MMNKSVIAVNAREKAKISSTGQTSMNVETNKSKSIRKKRILYIVEAMGGGVFTYIVDLANQLWDKYDVYIAYAVRPQTPEDYQDYFDKRIKLIEVKNFTRSIDLMKDAKAYLEIRKIANEIQPDIIHLHSSKAGVLGRWAFNGRKTPMFYTPHGYSFLMQNYGWLKRTIYRIVELVTSKRCCTTISCSLGEHKETLKLTKMATFVNNGIDIVALQRLVESCSVTNSEHQFTVFTLGRISYQKNPEQFNAVAEKLPDIRFLWIGDGELRDKITSPNIEVTGWVNRDKALEYALRADVFILTSLWEGLPIALLESMYIRKICVVSNVIGNKDVIQNGVNGYICNNVDDYVNVLKSIQSNPNKTIIDKAYKDILDEYNTSILGERYRTVYSLILKDLCT